MPEFAEPGDFAGTRHLGFVDDPIRDRTRDPIRNPVEPARVPASRRGHPTPPADRRPDHRRPRRSRRVPLVAGGVLLVGVGSFAALRGTGLTGRQPGGPDAAPTVTASARSRVDPQVTSPAAGPLTPGTVSAVAPGASAASVLGAPEQQLVVATNAARTARGCPPLAVDGRLAAAAGGHADDMVRRHYFAHDAPDGTDYQARLRAEGFPPTVATAENIAAGYASAKTVLADWMSSPGHRATILNCSYTTIGTGYNPGSVLPGYAGGAWVQLLGAL